MNLRAWLRRTPQPTRLLVDGKTIPMPDGPRRWADLEATIEALDASRIEAYGPDGGLIRATVIEADGQIKTAAADAPPKPSGPTELAQLGSILTAACDAPAKRHAEAYEHAFNAIVSIANASMAQAAQLQAALQAQQQKTLDLQERLIQTQAPDDVGELVEAFGPLMQGGRPKPPTPTPTTPKPNGAQPSKAGAS